MRPQPLLKLLESIKNQSLYPNEILIIDGSTDNSAQNIFLENNYKDLKYFKVSDENRGLTKQRNFGINKTNNTSEIICFLDDDIILEHDYFENLLKTYHIYPNALGVGGYIIDDLKWVFVGDNYKPLIKEFYFQGWKTKEGSRFILRKILGLDSNQSPGYSTNFSHGRHVGFLPPNDKIYPVEQLMGGVSSFKKEVFDALKFSTYFEGYGLYEDADFTIRVSKIGSLYINTKAKLKHYHDASGRPNQYQYGKMVVRNGWYVWRIKNPTPKFIDKLKWNSITILLIIIRFSNFFTTNKRKEAFTESLGRTLGLLSLIFTKPKL